MEGWKFYVIAGEASGDLHAANLMKALRQEDASVQFRFWGGDLMQEVAGDPVKHIRDLAFMGFAEVVMNLRTILNNMRFCKADILSYKPDAVILVDYPGFNLRIAEWAKKQGIKVYYYVSPQVWAWKQKRVYKIKQSVDHLFAILPFEQDFYKKFDYQVEYVGHPLLDAIEQFRERSSEGESFHQKWNLDDRPIIAILPGSRKQEVSVKLPIMLEAIKEFPMFQCVIAGAPALDPSFYEPLIGHTKAKIIHGETYSILSHASVGIITSGTATLETALFEVPEVVCYKGSPISYQIAKRLIKIRFISLVNLIMDREVVRELIQHECNPERIREEVRRLLPGGDRRQQVLDDYKKLKIVLGGGGASKKVAQSLLKTIQTSHTP